MNLRALSPVDGRYADKLDALRPFLSEWALMKYRVLVESRWLMAMAEHPGIKHVRPLTAGECAQLDALSADFDDEAARRIKAIEARTNHDVKAIEYYLRERLAGSGLADLAPSVHFACTSDDINNLAYALMLRDAMHGVWLPRAEAFISALADLAREHADVPMLARTHGQAAAPTTLGKELAVFAQRLRRQFDQISRQEYRGKLNGAVGAFNAHQIAYPELDWLALSRDFVTGLGLAHNPLTTQIEDHDGLAELAHGLARFHTVTLDFSRDMWSYISLGYFRQNVVAREVGSSTMPHKVNPIDFENAEANLGISSATLTHLAEKLPVSRLQRDLSDSSALRNIGVAIAHSDLALQSLTRGLAKLALDGEALAADLDDAWEVLAEAVQTVMRMRGVPDAYERLKTLTRGHRIDRERLHAFIQRLEIPEDDKQRLLQLTPASYLGLAEKLARGGVDERHVARAESALGRET